MLPPQSQHVFPSSTVVIEALTAAQPEIGGCSLQFVTIAHIIALEKTKCQLVFNEQQSEVLDALLAILVLSLTGDEALKAAQQPGILRARAGHLSGNTQRQNY